MIPARVNRECSNACIFCAAEGAALHDDDRPGPHVALVGGEPSLEGDLEERVAAARRRGATRITLQSNASHLAGRLGSLREAGLDGLELALHGPVAVHDYLTGRAGSHGDVMSALREARELGLPVGVTTLLTRSSYRHVHELPGALREMRVRAWRISVPEVAGRLRAAFDSVYPRLGMALPHAVRALVSAEAHTPTRLVRAPLCLTGPYADRSVAGTGAYGRSCDRCAARPFCPGVDPAYLERFGGDELRAREPVTPRPDPEAWLFAGVGDAARAVPRRNLPVVE